MIEAPEVYRERGTGEGSSLKSPTTKNLNFENTVTWYTVLTARQSPELSSL